MSASRGLAANWIIATGVLLAILYAGRTIMAPFALAVFLFLIMEGFARAISERFSFIALIWARTLSVLAVVCGFVLFIVLLANGVSDVSGKASGYEDRINGLISTSYGMLGLENAPTLTELVFNDSGQRFFAMIAGELRSVSSDLVLILIYVAFLFLAQANWSAKLDRIFMDDAVRDKVRDVGEAARRGIETYLWTQTLISAIITSLTYVSLLVLGVENAILLCALIFVLNYIPTIGSIVASVIPPLFALVQPETPGWIPGIGTDQSYIYAALVFGLVSFWQFSIGNFVQPRIMGESLNLSALVVLLSLAVWGAVWGIPGMFLSAPLTVLLMILCAQSESTRWISVLLSSNGQPIPETIDSQSSMNTMST